MLRSTLRRLARRLTRRPSPTRRASSARRRQPSLEALEARLVPAVSLNILNGVLTAQCDSGSNTVTVDHVVVATKAYTLINGHAFADASYNSIRINGGAGGTVTDIHANVKPLTVFGDSAKDVVNLGDAFNRLQSIQAKVLLEDENGFSDTVNINDQGDGALRAVALSTILRQGDSSLGQVSGLGAAAIQWDYHDTAAVNLNLGTGATQVNVNGTGPLVTTISNRALHAAFDVGNGNVAANIHGTLNLVTRAPGADVDIFDQNDTQGRTATLDTITRLNQSSLGRLGGLGSAVITWDYLGTSDVFVDGGSGANTFNIHGTVVDTNFTSHGPATINVGQGGSLAGIKGFLGLENDSGPHNTININDQNDSRATTVTLNDAGVGTFSAFGVTNLIAWNDAGTAAVNLNLGVGATQVNVLGTGVPTNIFNHGNATIIVSNNGFASNGSLVGIAGALHLENLGGTDSVFINDLGDTTAAEVTVDTLAGNVGRVTGLSAPITFRNDEVNFVDLTLGTGITNVNVLASGAKDLQITDTATATVSVGNNGSIDGIQGFLFLLNTNGTDFVNIDNSSDDVNETFDMITFASSGTTLGQVFRVGRPGAIGWDVAHTVEVTLFGGFARDTYNILGTGVPTTIVNTGTATFNLGNNSHTLSDIKGALNLVSQGQGTTQAINVFDEGDATSPSVTLDSPDANVGRITGLSAPITFENSQTSQLFLNLGPATGKVFVDAVGNLANGTFINNSSNATVFVGTGTLTAIQGFLQLGNVNGSDTVIIDDSEDSTGQTFGLISFPGAGPEGATTLGQVFGTFGSANEAFITWDNATTNSVTLFGGDGGNTFNVFETGTAITIDGGFGANTFNVNPFATGQSLGANILGPLTLEGGGNANTGLNLNEQNNPNFETFNFVFSQLGTGDLKLGSSPGFNLAFSAMNFVDLFTNGFSAVNDFNDAGSILHVLS
jgi:hypothetical protein